MYSLVKHCNASADWNSSNSDDASFRDKTFDKIENLRFVSSPSSSRSGSGQMLINFSNKGNSLRSDITSRGLPISPSPSTNSRFFCRVGSNFKRLIAAFEI